MILKNSSNKIALENFLTAATYLGISISSKGIIRDYVDLERFFLVATCNFSSSRIVEGFLCWVLRYGHLLSPSKVRRLILSETDLAAERNTTKSAVTATIAIASSMVRLLACRRFRTPMIA